MRFFACVVGAKSASWRSGVCDGIRSYCKFTLVTNSPTFQIHPCRRANCNSPLHVCFLDVRKYVNTQKTSWAWYEYVCARCRGELQFALVANRPYRELCFQVLKIVKINTINKIKPINNEKIFIFAL